MKKLEIIIKQEKLDELKEMLDENQVSGVNITNIIGYGNQKGIVKKYRGTDYKISLLPKIKVETVVEDEKADKLIDQIVEKLATGTQGDGKIFVQDIQEVVRIRTGERGKGAL